MMADSGNKYSGLCPECGENIYASCEFLTVKPPLMVVHCPACGVSFMV
jgi:transcription elongation factor Elf1